MIKKLALVVLSAFIFTFLFYKQGFGINVFIFEISFFIWLISSKQFNFNGKNQLIFGIGFLLTSLFTILTHTTFVYITHLFSFIIFIGVLINPYLKSIINYLGLSINSFFFSQLGFVNQLSNTNIKGQKFGSFIWRMKIFIIPLFIIFIFITIYRFSNPIFDTLVSNFFNSVSAFFNAIFIDFEFLVVFVFIIGIIISNFLFYRITYAKIIEEDLNSSGTLRRKRTKLDKSYSFISLKNEYKSAIFLFIVLNILLLIFNSIEVNSVWLHFNWEGQYLKDFVHEGAYMLILSILISIFLVLYFFRGNLNFYSQNKFLKILSYIWLIQNAILTISVAIRNFKYIDYFSLAYKRIGVIIFLILVLYGLYTVFVKVKLQKSSFYLFKTNALAVYIILVFASFINWDIYIAKYNFKHADKSFLHLDYLSTMSDDALPYLDKTPNELENIDSIQNSQFDFRYHYLSKENYISIIDSRKKQFKNDWENKKPLSWNLPEYLAYHKLFDKKNTTK